MPVDRRRLSPQSARARASWLRAACVAGTVGALCACTGAAPPETRTPAPLIDTAPIEIVRPATPLPVRATVRAGSLVRSRVNPAGVLYELESVLTDANVFASVIERGYASAGAPDASVWELELAGSDYGGVGAYTLELEVLVLRDRQVLATYRTEQSVRQRDGVKDALVVGPPELGRLAERGIRDLVRQLAADIETLRAL
jgi:hypothetical protein